jgi:hypothetical protein
MEVANQLAVRKYMGVNENENYRPLHLDTNLSKGTVCSKNGYGCK